MSVRLSSILGIICIVALCGCGASIKHGAANIKSTPSGAEVVNLRDASNLGITPVQVNFPGQADSSEYVTVQFRKVGYMDRISSFWITRKHGSKAAALAEPVDVHVELEKRVK